jgi:hypothetical protein
MATTIAKAIPTEKMNATLATDQGSMRFNRN